ncbi:hypothetical protein MYX76_15310 [Desulfobacterota bacterium AH_259_B03_O07]|nr:hypothetical protein [Desulfobacterota bacterium AH_259_B03_O07]
MSVKCLSIYVILLLVFHIGCQASRRNVTNQIHTANTRNEQKTDAASKNNSVTPGDNLEGSIVEPTLGADDVNEEVEEPADHRKEWYSIIAGAFFLIATAAIFVLANSSGD